MDLAHRSVLALTADPHLAAFAIAAAARSGHSCQLTDRPNDIVAAYQEPLLPVIIGSDLAVEVATTLHALAPDWAAREFIPRFALLATCDLTADPTLLDLGLALRAALIITADAEGDSDAWTRHQSPNFDQVTAWISEHFFPC